MASIEPSSKRQRHLKHPGNAGAGLACLDNVQQLASGKDLQP
jgi:hypothetical protein